MTINKTPWQGLLVYLEINGENLTPLSLEIAAKAFQMAAASGQEVFGLVIQDGAEEGDYKTSLNGLPFKRLLVYRLEDSVGFQAKAAAEALIDAAELLRPSVVLIGATDRGKDIAPYGAARLAAGLTADCTGLDIIEGGLLLQTRPAFGGNVMADIITPEARPQFATVRAGALRAPLPITGDPLDMEMRPFPLPVEQIGGMIRRRGRLPTEVSIVEARLIVAVGCGLKTAADLELVRRAAGSLGAALASTRGLVERGWMPPESQIGLSGHSVSPELLITLGVSGSVQFMAGIGGARRIIAVNTDPEARIFSAAHLGLVADLYEVLPKLFND